MFRDTLQTKTLSRQRQRQGSPTEKKKKVFHFTLSSESHPIIGDIYLNIRITQHRPDKCESSASSVLIAGDDREDACATNSRFSTDFHQLEYALEKETENEKEIRQQEYFNLGFHRVSEGSM